MRRDLISSDGGGWRGLGNAPRVAWDRMRMMGRGGGVTERSFDGAAELVGWRICYLRAPFVRASEKAHLLNA